MLEPESTVVILNPAAAGGRVRRERDDILRKLAAALGDLSIAETTRPSDASNFTKEAIAGGARTVLSLGGDGTHSSVAAAILDAQPESGAVAFGVLPFGTGGDFRRILHASDTLEDSLDALRHAESACVDLGIAELSDGIGELHQRPFLNIASCGISAWVSDLANQSSKRFGGRATYLAATAQALRNYQPSWVEVIADGESVGEFEIDSIFAGNARYAGGGMRLAPNALIDDGKLDVAIVRHGDARQNLKLIPGLYDGSYVHDGRVVALRCTRLEVRHTDGYPPWIELDGEVPGPGDVAFTVAPGVLRLLNPSEAVLSQRA